MMVTTVILLVVGIQRFVKPSESLLPSDAFACSGSGIYTDIHDGDQKRIDVSTIDRTLSIRPHGSDQTWLVTAKLDPESCNATVDFNVPGKPNPPPVKLMATFWSMHKASSSASKYALAFTDPSGKLAPPEQPLNIWIILKSLG